MRVHWAADQGERLFTSSERGTNWSKQEGGLRTHRGVSGGEAIKHLLGAPAATAALGLHVLPAGGGVPLAEGQVEVCE